MGPMVQKAAVYFDVLEIFGGWGSNIVIYYHYYYIALCLEDYVPIVQYNFYRMAEHSIDACNVHLKGTG